MDENDIFGKLITQNELYFASSYNWDRTWSQSCKGGLKVKVIIEGYRNEMDIIESNQDWKDFVNSEEIKNLKASIGHLSRMLVLQQFADEQRIRSEGI